ncbi:hypothetical protein HQ545_07980 [Candidatus Woesearchaeota archaeon]|nr:hypothetical protein [Candidatus Woesearchaeota archaeon]
MVELLVNIGMYFWELFKVWISTLFVVPFTHSDMLWLLIPIWTTWFFAEFFQEKNGTSMGNAITNSVVVIWGSIDCTRQTVGLIVAGQLTSTFDIILRVMIIIGILSYGVVIIVLGLKGKKIVKYIGRIREVTYAFAIFAPVFYNAVPFSLNHIIGAILFFPLFYFAIELFDRYTPNPKAVVNDMGKKKEDPKEFGSEDLSSGFDKGKNEELGDFKL